MKVLIIAVGLLCTVADAQQAKDQFEIKEIRIGMPIKDVDALYPAFSQNCNERTPTPSGGIICMHVIPPEIDEVRHKYSAERANIYPALKSFAGQRVRYFALTKMNEQVQSVRVSLQASGWTVVIGALKEKFGASASSVDSMVQNRAGASFDQTVITWKANGQYLIAKKLGADVDHMAVELGSEAADAALLESTKEKGKAGAKDL